MWRFLKARIANAEVAILHACGRLPIHRIRVNAVRMWGADVHANTTMYHGFEIRAARRLKIGSHTIIGNDAILDARGGLSIGSNVNLSTGVNIWTAQHAWDDTNFKYVASPVFIHDHAWLSTRVTVLPGVVIGEGAVVAAGAVVTKDVAPYSLVGGVPAKFLAHRPRHLTYQLAPPRRKAWWW